MIVIALPDQLALHSGKDLTYHFLHVGVLRGHPGSSGPSHLTTNSDPSLSAIEGDEVLGLGSSDGGISWL